MSDSAYFSRKLSDKLQRIANEQAPRAPHDDSQVVAAAEHLGFVNREPEPAIEVRETLGPVVMMTMRVPVRVARQFKQFCKTNRYSYWEGVEELMKRAGC
jgi:hypothetical protein